MLCDRRGWSTDNAHTHLHVPVHGIGCEVRGRDQRVIPVRHEHFGVQLKVRIVLREAPSQQTWEWRASWPRRGQYASIVTPIGSHPFVDDCGNHDTPRDGVRKREYEFLDDSITIVTRRYHRQ